jgi:hypothetical protein
MKLKFQLAKSQWTWYQGMGWEIKFQQKHDPK